MKETLVAWNCLKQLSGLTTLGEIWLTGHHWLCLGPTGHYRGSLGVEDQIVYVAMLADGSQRTCTAAEFAEQIGRKDDLETAEFLGKGK